MKYIEVITTFETNDDAEKMANQILGAKIGACCSIQEIKSIYNWKEKIESGTEFQLTIKTKETLYPELEALILKNHPYETPQIVALPILMGSKDYLSWMDKETK